MINDDENIFKIIMNFKRKYTSLGRFPIDVLGISDLKLFEDAVLDLLIFFPIVFYK